MHGQARRHFTRQRVLDLELVHGQREHDLGSEFVLESIVIGGRTVIGLAQVVPKVPTAEGFAQLTAEFEIESVPPG